MKNVENFRNFIFFLLVFFHLVFARFLMILHFSFPISFSGIYACVSPRENESEYYVFSSMFRVRPFVQRASNEEKNEEKEGRKYKIIIIINVDRRWKHQENMVQHGDMVQAIFNIFYTCKMCVFSGPGSDLCLFDQTFCLQLRLI